MHCSYNCFNLLVVYNGTYVHVHGMKSLSLACNTNVHLNKREMSRATARMYFNELNLLPTQIDIAPSVVNPLSGVPNLLCKLFKWN